MVKITQDLSSLVGSLSDTKKELQEILSVFNSLSAAASNLGGTINSAFGQGSLSSSQVSSRGSSVVVGDFNDAIKKAQADIINKPQNIGQIFDLQGQLVSNAINKPITNAPTGGTDPLGSLSQRLINQYGAKDLPRMLNQADTAANLSTNLSNRAANLAQGTMEQRALSNVIKELENTLSTRQKEFTEVYRQFAAAQTSGDVVKTAETMESLKKAMASLEKAVEDATDVNKELAKKDGDGGGGGRGFFERHGASIGRGLTIAGAVAATYAGYERTAAAFQSAIQNSQSNYWNTTHGMQGVFARQQIGAFDMTDPGNILRHKGDILFGAQFLGESGLRRADAIARREEEIRIDSLRRERNANFASVAAATLGAAGIGFGLGGPAGALLGGGGALVASGYSAIKNYFGSEYTGLQGGLSSGIGGMFGNFLGMGDQAAFRQRELQAQSQMNIVMAREQMRDQEEQRFAPQRMALGEIRQMYDARRAGLALVGGRVLSVGAAMGLSGASLYDRGSAEQNLLFKEQTGRARARETLLRGSKEIAESISSDDLGITQLGALRTKMDVAKALRERAEGIDGQITATGAPLAKMQANTIGGEIARDAAQRTTISDLLVSPAEFITKAAQSLNAFGPGGMSQGTNIRRTSELIRMGYGGLGGFDQLTGNIAAFSRVTGDSDSLEKLKNVMASAVSIGFNNSRLAQEFVRTTAELSQGLGITNTNFTSGVLAGGTGALTGLGVGGEMGLSMIAKGMGQYNQLTNTGGIFGAAKMIGMFSGGGRIGEAGGLIQSMGAVELAAAERELESGDIKNPKLAAALNNIQSSRGIGRREALAELRRQVGGASSGVNAPMRSIGDMINKNESLKEWTKLSPKEREAVPVSERERMARDVISFGMEQGSIMGIGAEGGAAAGTLQLERLGLLPKRNLQELQNQITKGVGAAQADKALALRRRYLDSVLRSTGGLTSGISTQEYGAEYEKGARMTFEEGKFKGQEIDPSKFSDPEYFAAAQESLKGKSRFDLAMQTAAMTPDSENVQQVRIVNLIDMAGAIAGGMSMLEGVKVKNAGANGGGTSDAPAMNLPGVGN